MGEQGLKQIPIEPFQTAAAWYDHARDGVVKEMVSALNKHGEVTKDPVRGAGVLCEEVGEVMREALDVTRPGALVGFKIMCLERMIEELGQTAGFAIMLLCSMQGELYKLRKGEQ